VLGYHKDVPQFPHESTADQFGESQFESYRALGYHIAHEALAPIGKAATRRHFFAPLKKCADPPAAPKAPATL